LEKVQLLSEARYHESNKIGKKDTKVAGDGNLRKKKKLETDPVKDQSPRRSDSNSAKKRKREITGVRGINKQTQLKKNRQRLGGMTQRKIQDTTKQVWRRRLRGGGEEKNMGGDA